jgi:hypothetical protein
MPHPCTHPTTYEAVLESMNRPLTISEQQTYRGITSSATTGRKYDKLYNIITTTELIKAEFYGRRATPSDEPENMYLFSRGRGKTARMNDEYVRLVRKRWEEEEEKDESGNMKRIRERHVPQTMEELHTQYLNFEVPGTEEDKKRVEEQLTQVAEDVVTWWNELIKTESPDIGRCRREGCQAGKGEEKGI